MKKILTDKQVSEILDKRDLPKSVTAKAKTEPGELPSFLNLSVSADGKRAVISIYDEISYWTGNDARTFQETLNGLDVDTIEVRINSPGGSVFDGVAIYNMLVSHKATIETYNDGLAASIASVIFMAGEKRFMAENAMVMIHNPSMFMRGTAAEFRHYAGVLDKVKEAILNTYVSATGKDRKELADAMDSEPYYIVSEAIEMGFATHQVEPLKVAALWNPDDFDELPEKVRALANFQKKETKEKPPEEEEETPEPTSKGTIEDVQAAVARLQNLRKLHGL